MPCVLKIVLSPFIWALICRDIHEHMGVLQRGVQDVWERHTSIFAPCQYASGGGEGRGGQPCQSEYGRMSTSWYRLASPYLLNSVSVPPP